MCYIDRGFLSPSECDHIKQIASKYPSISATTFNGNKDHRNSDVKWIEVEQKIADKVSEKARDANLRCFNLDVDYKIREQQFTEYLGSVGGKYDWHHDVDLTSKDMYDRKLSVVIQLTDPAEYEGGKLMFQEISGWNPEAVVGMGSIIIFPSNLQHAVTPVTSGKRNSFVTWLWGPRWR